MNFRSDNVTGIAPEILSAIIEANAGSSAAYGDDEYTQRLDGLLAEIFECEVRAFPVTTGTAANALSLGALSAPHGAIYCHAKAHLMIDECGAPEMFTGGAKMVPLDGAGGKLDAAELEALLAGERAGDVHHVQPAAISISQTTEAGTLYRPEEIAGIAEVARRHKLRLHMDGARFANAIAGLGVAPKDLTWKAGVDVLSLGATKNGAMAAEMVVFFDATLAENFYYRRKRAGQLLSKGRFIAAQLLAYFGDGLWLSMARHANNAAARLAQGLARAGVTLAYPVEANMVFPLLPAAIAAKLGEAGFGFYEWAGQDPVTIRLVTAFDTRIEDLDRLIGAIEGLNSA